MSVNYQPTPSNITEDSNFVLKGVIRRRIKRSKENIEIFNQKYSLIFWTRRWHLWLSIIDSSLCSKSSNSEYRTLTPQIIFPSISEKTISLQKFFQIRVVDLMFIFFFARHDFSSRKRGLLYFKFIESVRNLPELFTCAIHIKHSEVWKLRHTFWRRNTIYRMQFLRPAHRNMWLACGCKFDYITKLNFVGLLYIHSLQKKLFNWRNSSTKMASKLCGQEFKLEWGVYITDAVGPWKLTNRGTRGVLTTDILSLPSCLIVVLLCTRIVVGTNLRIPSPLEIKGKGIRWDGMDSW